METDLGNELAAADPAAIASSAAVRNALSQLIDATEHADRARNRHVVRVAVAATAVAALGGTGAAAATGHLGLGGTGWWNSTQATTQPVTTDDGEQCRLTYAPRALHDAGNPVSPGDRAAAMAAAAEFLAAFDSTTLDGLSPDDAFGELNTQLGRTLTQLGLSTYAVSVALATDCDTGTKR